MNLRRQVLIARHCKCVRCSHDEVGGRRPHNRLPVDHESPTNWECLRPAIAVDDRGAAIALTFSRSGGMEKSRVTRRAAVFNS